MKRLQIFAFCCLASLALAQQTAGPATPALDPRVAQLVEELRAQQEAMAANQVKIDEKLVAVAEAIRVARIYSSRSGN